VRYVFICLYLFAAIIVYAFISSAMGWKHGGGAIPLMVYNIVVGTIGWRLFKKKPN